MALSELASAFKARNLGWEKQLVCFSSSGGMKPRPTVAQVFRHLSSVPMRLLERTHNEILLAAACDLIGVSISFTEIALLDKSSVPHWKSIIEMGLRHKSTIVRGSAIKAFGSVSGLVDCSDDLLRLIRELRVGLPPMQQSLGTLVGGLDYKAFRHGVENALAFILESVDYKVRDGTFVQYFRLTHAHVLVVPFHQQHRSAKELLRFASLDSYELARPDTES